MAEANGSKPSKTKSLQGNSHQPYDHSHKSGAGEGEAGVRPAERQDTTRRLPGPYKYPFTYPGKQRGDQRLQTPIER